MGTPKPTVRVRIVVSGPPVGVRFALQEGKSNVIDPKESSGVDLVFEFPLTVADSDSRPVRFTGKFAQGPALARFVYISSGTLAGQFGSRWTRRAKVPLHEVPAELVSEAQNSNRVLCADISGCAKDGGPACASVKILTGWKCL